MEVAQHKPQQGQRQWETFEDDDQPLLLSHLPRTTAKSSQDDDRKPDNDFQFQVSTAGGLLLPTDAAAADMCAADDLFFNGQILPLRPSVAPSRCGSWSDSVDRSSTPGLDTSRSNSNSSSSSRRSSNCVSRSHSSNSSTPSVTAASEVSRPPSLSNNFYAHPSPKPQLRSARPKTTAGRRSASSAPPGWGVFLLGLVRAPQIDLHDSRPRRSSTGGGRKSDVDTANAKKIARAPSDGSSTSKRFDACASEAKAEKKVARLVGRGLSCKSSPEAVVEPSPSPTTKMKKKEEEEGQRLRRVDSMCRSRIFEWLEELSIAKAVANRDSGGGGGGGGH
ncbi:hypothetical protein Cni_G03123 [Canna indica]|uniref:Uncharacterized protein n=1 Tax=Canna indica TaxID=4628 RepID=A0AAQ3JTC5_9LILI|nr:hypothetical protein Cni_G03123 [Canna indica]